MNATGATPAGGAVIPGGAVVTGDQLNLTLLPSVPEFALVVDIGLLNPFNAAYWQGAGTCPVVLAPTLQSYGLVSLAVLKFPCFVLPFVASTSKSIAPAVQAASAAVCAACRRKNKLLKSIAKAMAPTRKSPSPRTTNNIA
jgi:hypothetical protein